MLNAGEFVVEWWDEIERLPSDTKRVYALRFNGKTLVCAAPQAQRIAQHTKALRAIH
jgi:hypothetical protein